MRHVEHEIQVACKQWFELTHKRATFIAIPNGGARSAITGSYLKAEGAKAGAPDVVLIYPNGKVVWVEFKAPKGRCSPQQIDFGDRLRELGHTYWIARSLDDFVALVFRYDEEQGFRKY